MLWIGLLSCYARPELRKRAVARPSQRLVSLPKSGFLAGQTTLIGRQPDTHSNRLLQVLRNRRGHTNNIFRTKHARSHRSGSGTTSHDYDYDTDECIPDPDAPHPGKGSRSSRSNSSSTGKAGGGKGRGMRRRREGKGGMNADSGKGKAGRKRGRHRRKSRSSRRLRGHEPVDRVVSNVHDNTRQLNGKGGKGEGSRDFCPPGFIPKPPAASSKQELQLAIQRYIESDGEESFYGPPISFWDVSEITDFSSLFEGAETCNEPLGDWETSQVTNMASMFRGASLFNQDISEWVGHNYFTFYQFALQ